MSPGHQHLDQACHHHTQILQAAAPNRPDAMGYDMFYSTACHITATGRRTVAMNPSTLRYCRTQSAAQQGQPDNQLTAACK